MHCRLSRSIASLIRDKSDLVPHLPNTIVIGHGIPQGLCLFSSDQTLCDHRDQTSELLFEVVVVLVILLLVCELDSRLEGSVEKKACGLCGYSPRSAWLETQNLG